MINSNVQGNVPQPPKLNAVGPKPQCQTDRKFTRLLAVLVTNHFAGSWHRLSDAEPSKDPSAAASSGQLGISCKVLVGAKSAANSHFLFKIVSTGPRESVADTIFAASIGCPSSAPE